MGENQPKPLSKRDDFSASLTAIALATSRKRVLKVSRYFPTVLMEERQAGKRGKTKTI
jgi:hypothetical protein